MDGAVIQHTVNLWENPNPKYIKVASDSQGMINFNTDWNKVIVVSGNKDKIGAATVNLTGLSDTNQTLDKQSKMLTAKSSEGLQPKYYNQCKCYGSVWKFRHVCCQTVLGSFQCFWVWHTSCSGDSFTK